MDLAILDVNGTLFPLARCRRAGRDDDQRHGLEWDDHGAVTAGLLASWVNRDDARSPDPFAPPTVRGNTFAEVVEALLAHA